MKLKTMRLEVGTDGIALIILDDPTRPMNVVSPEFITDMVAAIERVAGHPEIRSAIITSAKPAFMAGADLKYIASLAGGAISRDAAFEFSQRPSLAMHRRLETCGKPFVAAINGLALGGGYELCLACHYRVIVDDPKVMVGLPEVTVGLLPASGGTQRLPRMIGLEAAVPLLLEGKTVGPIEALQLGLVDALVSAPDLVQSAKDWLMKRPDPVRSWDKKGFSAAGGLLNPAVTGVMSMCPAAIAAQTQPKQSPPIN